MTAGDIVKTAAFIAEEVAVDTDEDISKGEIINDVGGAGFEQADAGTKGPFMVALEDHDYSEETTHKITAAIKGIVKVKKLAGSAIAQGRWVEVSSTAGAVTQWDYTTPGDHFDIVGIAMDDAASAATEVAVLLGV